MAPSAPLKLDLVELPADPFFRRGTYGNSRLAPGEGKVCFPLRALYLHPDAAASLAAMEAAAPGALRYSDIWRSAQRSLEARKEGEEREARRAAGETHVAPQGAQRPGFSGHNYGLVHYHGYPGLCWASA